MMRVIGIGIWTDAHGDWLSQCKIAHDVHCVRWCSPIAPTADCHLLLVLFLSVWAHRIPYERPYRLSSVFATLSLLGSIASCFRGVLPRWNCTLWNVDREVHHEVVADPYLTMAFIRFLLTDQCKSAFLALCDFLDITMRWEYVRRCWNCWCGVACGPRVEGVT